MDRVGDIAVPTLVVAGFHDEAMPSVWEPFVKGIPGACSHVFPESSHMPHVEEPTHCRSASAPSCVSTTEPHLRHHPPSATPRPLRNCMSASTPKTPTHETDGDLAEFGYRQELNRTLSTADLLIYGLVFMVPIAPWAIFGVVFNQAKGMVPLVYLIGLVAMIFTALSYAQMSKAFPIAGSVYAYVGRGLNKHLGFVAGWTILLDYLLVPTLLYVFAAESMAGIFPGVPKQVWIILFLVLNTGVNYIGISFTAIGQPHLPGGRAPLHRHLPDHGDRRGEQGRRRRDVHHQAPVRRGALHSGPRRHRLVDRGAQLLGVRRHRDAERGGQGRSTAAGVAMITGLVLVAAFFVAQTWLAAMLVPDKPSFRDARSTTPSSASSRTSATTGGRWRSSP